MAPIRPGLDYEDIENKLDSVFKMMEKHFSYVDDVVDKIDLLVDNVKLPKSKFRDIAHTYAQKKGKFEYKADKQIEKLRKFHHKVLGAFVAILMGIILSLFMIMILTSLFEDSNKETPTKQPAQQIEKLVTPKNPTNKNGPIFREIK